MIYDLKELKQNTRAGMFDAEIAIAERLEALVEAQKPRFVELQSVTGSPIFINPKYVIQVINFSEVWLSKNKEFAGCVCVVHESADANESSTAVKGTLAEVMAKIRGGQ